MSVFSLFVAALACDPAPVGRDEAEYARARERMVVEQIEARGIKDPLTLAALRRVPRHLFVPAQMAREAYSDSPLPIGHGQTISQPFIVAFMTEASVSRRGRPSSKSAPAPATRLPSWPRSQAGSTPSRSSPAWPRRPGSA